MSTFTQKNSISLIKNGKPFIEANIHHINSAKKFILLHTYIFRVDEVTGPVIHALYEAARRGVAIYIIADGYGSMGLPSDFLESLEEAGIYFKYFKPLSPFNQVGRRMHQKVLLIDNQRCLLGGINLSKEYNLPEEMDPWLDYACALEGEEVKNVYKRIKKFYLEYFPEKKSQFKLYNKINPRPAIETCLIKTNVNDWTRYKTEIFKSYLSAIRGAKESIYLLAPYFIPSRKLLFELKKARRRGVEVHLILGQNSDHKIVQKVEQYFFKWYIMNDLKIYEWPKSIVHGKLALIDQRWVTIGSYNHNYISKFGNIEINLEVINRNFSEIVSQEFQSILQQSHKMNRSDFESRYTFLNRLYMYSSFTVLSFISFISIFLIFRRASKSR
ncbi:MAG: hypothetical protein CME62_13865 [Halobacteriovoraceae bacterium]|nr:hypothetical protein [Halobacteriovoraceae bacterium]